MASRLGGGELSGKPKANRSQCCSTAFREMPTFAPVGNKPYNLGGFMLIMHGPNSAGSYWMIDSNCY